jgi:hypothetical protein
MPIINNIIDIAGEMNRRINLSDNVETVSIKTKIKMDKARKISSKIVRILMSDLNSLYSSNRAVVLILFRL